MTRECVVCGQYVPGSRDVAPEPVPVHARCHHGRATERRFGVTRPDPTAIADGGLDRGGAGRDLSEALRRLRTALHDDIEIVPGTAGTVLEGPGGTQLVNGRTHDVGRWIDRRSRWGNPFKTTADGGEYRRYESVELYRGWFHGHVETDDWNPEQLRGAVLGCWCLPEMCHGVVVLNHLAETYSPQQRLVTDGGSYADEIEQFLADRLRTASDETVIVRPCHIREATGLSHGRYAYGVGQLREREDADVVLERWGRDQGGAWRVRWARSPAPAPDGGPGFQPASDLPREGGAR